MVIDFSALETRLVLEGMITQKVLPYNEETRNLKRGDVCNISFNGLQFKDYCLRIVNVTITSLAKLSNQDLFDEGFLYKPFFLDWMREKGFEVDDTIIKADFELVEN